jgi:hypothetical protein
VTLILAEQTLLIALDDEKGRDKTEWGRARRGPRRPDSGRHQRGHRGRGRVELSF